MPSPPPSTATAWAPRAPPWRVHQGFVVAVFVALGKLQVAIEKQPVPALPWVTTMRW